MIQSYPHFWKPPFEAPIYWRELEYIGPGFWGLCKGINWRYLLCIGPIFEGYVREYASAMWPPHGTSISLSWDPSATMGTLIESNLGISQMLWIYHILGGISINQLCWGTIGCQAFEPHLLVQSLEGWLRDLQQAQTCNKKMCGTSQVLCICARTEHMKNTNAHTTIHNPYGIAAARSFTIYA